MNESKEQEDRTNKAALIAKVGAVAAWSFLCFCMWFGWLMAVVGDTSTPSSDEAAGAAMCIVTGCTGSVYMFGLAVIMTFVVIFRR